MAVQSQVDIILRAVGAGQVTSAFNSIATAAGGVVRSFLPFATLGGAFAAGGLALRNAFNLADNFENLAKRIGGTVEGVQVLDFLARRSGQGADVFTKGLDNLRRSLAEARTGSEEAYTPFRKLNLTVAEFDGLPAERQLEILARAMVNAKDPSEAFLAIAQILGAKALPDLRVSLEKLATGYDNVAASAKAAGQIMSADDVRKIADTNARIEDTWHRVNVAAGGVAGGALDIVDGFTGIVAASDRLSKAENIFGKMSSQAAQARIELVKLLVEAGRFKAAQAELSKTPEKIPPRGLTSFLPLIGGGPFVADIGLNPAQFAAERAKLAAAIEAGLPKPQTAEQAAAAAQAAKITEEAKARAVAEEQANFWLTANAKKITDAVEANRQALLTDDERLKLTQLRVAGIDAETAAAVKSAGSDAERRKAELLHAEERSKLLRDIAQFEERITADKEKQAAADLSQKLGALRAQEITDQDRLEQITESRRDIERSTILDLATKRVRLDENTRAYQEQIAAVITLKEAELSLVTDAEQRANIEREIARLKRQSAEFGQTTAAPTRLEASRTGLAGLSDPTQHLQKGQGFEAGANAFLTGIGTEADNAAESINTTLNGALQGTSDLIAGIASGSLTFREAWGQATAWVGQQFLKMTTDMIARMIYRNTVERALVAAGVATHVSGESTKTAATVSGGAIRIGTVIKEALASVYHGAVAAFEALASIPYVGPILGAAALAGALALGLGIVSKIGHADGAIVRGPGGPRDDRIPAMLSNGEAVTRAAVVTKFGERFFTQLNNGVLDLSAIRGGVARADGGLAYASAYSIPDISIADRLPSVVARRDSFQIESATSRAQDNAPGLNGPRDVKINAFFDKNAMRRSMLTDFDAKVIDVIDRARHRWNI